ncbi:C6 zinc finger domain protein [Ilyonectria robusta]
MTGTMISAPDRNRIPKACEPCRRRKVKCNGQRPCQSCRSNPSACAYRLKARSYLRRAVSPPAPLCPAYPSLDRVEAEASVPARSRERSFEGPSPHLHDSVAAMHLAPQPTDSSQLFYGPSSNFAFLQQIHRAIVSRGSSSLTGRPCDLIQDGAGLDLFMQRNVFFGVPLRVDPAVITHFDPRTGLIDLVPRHLAVAFLDNFKAASLQLLPFFSTSELDGLLEEVYSPGHSSEVQPLKGALFFMVLAIGALSTTQTEIADTLFLAAKRESAVYEEAVTIPVIQLSLLIADYQLNMGRPSSGYIHVGNACRKGLALGLDTATPNLTPREIHVRNCTLWSLYFFETWLSFTVGRRSVIRREDIGCPHPAGQQLLVNLCDLAVIVEDSARSLWLGKSESLSQLYQTAQELYERIRRWGQTVGIGAIHPRREGAVESPISRLTLHNVYFHLVHTTFRPFLIAEYVLYTSSDKRNIGELWFRQACRNATDAAIDSIDFMHTMFQSIDVTKIRRYDSFFVEASCSVLLFDSLRHHSKYPNNLVYIKKGLHCLQRMTNDEPVTSVILSQRRILEAVQASVSAGGTTPSSDAATQLMPSRSEEHSQVCEHPNIEHPSLDQTISQTTNDLIHLHERTSLLPNDAFPNNLATLPYDEASLLQQPWPQFNFDVVTTDLFNYFPIDLCDNSSKE